MVIAMLVASFIAVKRLKRHRVNLTLFIEHSGSFLLSALIFSRLVYFFMNPFMYSQGFKLQTLINLVSFWDQGFSFFGALLGFTLMLGYRLRKEKEDIWKWLDALAVPLLIGMGIGYVGAFLGGVAYGSPSSLPWAIKYETITVKYTVPIHPIQIYTIILICAILILKTKLKRKKEFFQKNGNTALFITSLTSFGLFLLEFLRGDDTLLILGIRSSQIIYVILFLLSTGLIIYRQKKHEPV